MGFIFVMDAKTGEFVYEVEERAVKQSTVAIGETYNRYTQTDTPILQKEEPYLSNITILTF